MIIQTTTTLNKKRYIKTYSDKGYYIKKVGTNELYATALDLKPATYEETNQVIPHKRTNRVQNKRQA